MSALNRKRPLALGAALAAALALTGCISLLPEPNPRMLYRLDAGITETAPSPMRGAIPLSVERISASRALAGDKIAIDRGGAIAYMAGAAWASPAPAMFESVLEDAFQAEAPQVSPVRAEDGVSARFRLDVALRRFEAVYDQGDNAAPLVRVTVRARIIDRDERILAARQVFNHEVRASAHRQGAIVAAFSRASGDAASDIARWAAQVVCEADPDAAACN
ncbi:MAG: ABC-type transport auxiliary lipoprotein family protein [Oceanicaulis sp.]|nr:ABC-type transport auxiliary lipoprotein family protein [Oceanicaulis sp.]